MTTKTKSPKVAARTPKSKAVASPASERLRKEALASVAANIATLDAVGVGHNEQGGEPQKPDQPKPDQQQRQEPKKDASPRPGKKAAKPPATTATKTTKPAKAPKVKRLSCLDAAAQIIGKDPVGCKDLIAEMGRRGLWKSPNGRTPDASLYAAITREIAARKGEARFKKVDRGLFVAGPGTKN